MLVPHLYFNGRCEEAIAQYVKAFGAKVSEVIPYPEEENKRGVIHSEIFIHGQRGMMNDEAIGHPDMIVIYDTKEELMHSYEILKEGGRVTAPMLETDYSPCVVGLRDRFGID